MSEHPIAAVVGTFDGVHRGHRFLLDHLGRRARELSMTSCVYTFADHPLATLNPASAPLLLTTAAEKASLLRDTGVDGWHFDDFASISHLTARRYIELLAARGVRLLLLGYDNRFGSDRLSTVSDFVAAATGTGVTIEQAPQLTDTAGATINSSTIRRHIQHGDIVAANALLGYEYSITGTVVAGKQLGRTIGFPTANVQLPTASRKLPVSTGVYACRATVAGEHFPAMVNIGSRPTVDAPGSPSSIEAHLIGTDSDMYGLQLTLAFVERLRDEQHFDTIDRLTAQLSADRLATLQRIAK